MTATVSFSMLSGFSEFLKYVLVLLLSYIMENTSFFKSFFIRTGVKKLGDSWFCRVLCAERRGLPEKQGTE